MAENRPTSLIQRLSAYRRRSRDFVTFLGSTRAGIVNGAALLGLTAVSSATVRVKAIVASAAPLPGLVATTLLPHEQGRFPAAAPVRLGSMSWQASSV